MPHFRYQAYDESGGVEGGEVDAATREGALETLSRRGMLAFDLKEEASRAVLPWWQRDVFGGDRLSGTHLATFTHELASLVRAEIPIDEALRIVALQPMLPSRVRRITQECLESVVQGSTLSDALSRRVEAFPSYYVRLVRAGETSGALSDVLTDLAETAERASQTRARVASALVYPAILLVAAAAALAVILTVLVPTILPIFTDAGAEPPVLIRVLNRLSQFLSAHWIGLLCGLMAAAIALVAAVQSPPLRLAKDRALLRLPLIGPLIERRETARLARTLALLNRNGVPILDSLRISAGVMTNAAFRHAIETVVEDVKQGGSLTRPFTQAAIFPDLFLRLTAVGEKTGQLDVMHLRVAEIYDAAVERQLERLTSLITPILTLVIGASVGGLIISVMGAIFSVNDLALK